VEGIGIYVATRVVGFLIDMELDACEETTLHDANNEGELIRK
jgi:hypothetical protein